MTPQSVLIIRGMRGLVDVKITKNQMKNIEGNKIIAEFMGYKYVKSGLRGKQWLIHPTEHPMMVDPSEDSFNEYLKPEYHSSWDWLMPVVKKLSDIYNDCGHDPDAGFNLIKLGISEPIERVYLRVVEYIEWLNETANSANLANSAK